MSPPTDKVGADGVLLVPRDKVLDPATDRLPVTVIEQAGCSKERYAFVPTVKLPFVNELT